MEEEIISNLLAFCFIEIIVPKLMIQLLKSVLNEWHCINILPKVSESPGKQFLYTDHLELCFCFCFSFLKGQLVYFHVFSNSLQSNLLELSFY